jgi:ATP-dependent DNA helicase RecQ
MVEHRPTNLDEMAGISGVGAKKLESYGAAFLEVIAGEVEHLHPKRRKLAGRPAASLYDQLLEAQAQLSRGENGTDKPMSCSASLLAKVAATRPSNKAALDHLLGDRRSERFGAVFWDILVSDT